MGGDKAGTYVYLCSYMYEVPVASRLTRNAWPMCVYICLSSVWLGILFLILADEDHFNANVQLRRTARHDVGVAQKLQDEEVEAFRKEETKRKQEMRNK